MASKFINLKQYLLHISYLGTPYSGVSKGHALSKSVSDIIEAKLLNILPTITPFDIKCSSRTDKGVHAFWNTVSFKTNSPHSFETKKLRFVLNYKLSDERENIRVHQIKQIQSKTNMISNVMNRTYLYRLGIVDRCTFMMDCLTAWDSLQISFIGNPFDLDSFRATSILLSGNHDYTGFTNLSGLLNNKTPVKNLQISVVESPVSVLNMNSHPMIINETKIKYIDIYVTAESFMNKMVRYLVGCMIDVATGKITQDIAADVLNRGVYYLQEKPFQCAFPYGLYLYDLKHENESLNFDINQWKSEMDFRMQNPQESVEILSENVDVQTLNSQSK